MVAILIDQFLCVPLQTWFSDKALRKEVIAFLPLPMTWSGENWSLREGLCITWQERSLWEHMSDVNMKSRDQTVGVGVSVGVCLCAHSWGVWLCVSVDRLS